MLEWRSKLLTFFKEEYHIEEIIFIDVSFAFICLRVAGDGNTHLIEKSWTFEGVKICKFFGSKG